MSMRSTLQTGVKVCPEEFARLDLQLCSHVTQVKTRWLIDEPRGHGDNLKGYAIYLLWGPGFNDKRQKRTQLDFRVFSQQHILALDVAVDDVMSVQVS